MFITFTAMRRFLAAVITFLPFLSLGQALQGKLERAMEKHAENGEFSGVALVVRKGGVLLSKGYGYRDAGQKAENLPNTYYPIGSLTEQLTAEIILSLDSKAALSLEDKVYKYFPEIPNSDRISIKNLLTHTSGLYDYSADTVFLKGTAKKKPGRKDIFSLLITKELAFYPGMKYAYSAADYYLAGLIIEKVARWGYYELVQERIFKVCGMYLSGYDLAGLGYENKAQGYDGAKSVALPDTAMSYAAYGAYSTAGDLYKFYQSLRQHKMLPQDWQDLAFAPFKDQAALGWRAETIYNKKFMVHESTIPGYTAIELWQQQEDLFIVLLQNNMHPAIPIRTVADDLLKGVYGIEPKPKHVVEKMEEPQAALVSRHPLDKYVGEFEFTPEFSLRFYIQDNQLFAESANMKSILMIAEGPNVFRTTGVAAKVEFIKEKNGQIKSAILHQGGQDIPGDRIK